MLCSTLQILCCVAHNSHGCKKGCLFSQNKSHARGIWHLVYQLTFELTAVPVRSPWTFCAQCTPSISDCGVHSSKNGWAHALHGCLVYTRLAVRCPTQALLACQQPPMLARYTGFSDACCFATFSFWSSILCCSSFSFCSSRCKISSCLRVFWYWCCASAHSFLRFATSSVKAILSFLS